MTLPDAKSRNSTFLVTFLLLIVPCFACRATGVPHPEQKPIVGAWNVADSSGGMIQFGFLISENRNGSVTGVVQRIFAGNVGVDVSRFGQLRGQVNGSRLVLRASNDVDQSILQFELELVEDGLRVLRIQWAGESLVVEPNTWVAWRA